MADFTRDALKDSTVNIYQRHKKKLLSSAVIHTHRTKQRTKSRDEASGEVTPLVFMKS